ncbi:MAG: NnrS family protein [Acetobacteraceae bacterium]|nr:NnrS family protein [Acetobacteraceae bacterium]
MVFGQALAVVGGYLLTRIPPWQLRLTALAWVAARAAAAWPEAPAEALAALSVAATCAIALAAMWAFLRGAKRGGNMVFPVLLGSFIAADVWFHLGVVGLVPGGAWPGLALGIGIVVLLVAAMGGRLLSAAASGAAQKAGKARIPPRHGLERALLASLTAGFVGQAVAAPILVWAAPLVLAGMFLCGRVALWAPGLRHASGDVVALAAGQVWLGIGLLAWIATLAGPPVAGVSALHVALIGGVGGTLLVMMMRSAAQREARAMPRRAAPIVGALMGVAALARAFGAPDWNGVTVWLWLAASAVTAASLFGPGWSQPPVRGTGSRPPGPRRPGSPAPR